MDLIKGRKMSREEKTGNTNGKERGKAIWKRKDNQKEKVKEENIKKKK